MSVGDIRVTYLVDGEARVTTTGLFPASTEETWKAHRQWLGNDGRVGVSMGGFLIETADRKIVVDLGVGDVNLEIPDFARIACGSFIDSFKQTGLTPEEVDTVVFTHLHFDHVGWTTSGGNLNFRNARHVSTEGEWAHWQKPDASGFAPNTETVLVPLSARIEYLDDGEAIAPGVNVAATPGHTPGHLSLVVSSGIHRAVILGDVVSCPVQLAEPEWAVISDVDPPLARRTRDQLMAELEGSATLVAGGHFSPSVFGRVVPGQGRRLWQIGG